MRQKRRQAETIDDEQTTGASDKVQQDYNAKPAKRAKLTPLSDTTLQDLPNEMLECILVKAVVQEVKGMKLVKSVWKAKAGLVISRLRTVCSNWNNILTTDIFREIVDSILDSTAQGTFREEILHKSPIQACVFSVATLKDEIFMLCKPDYEQSLVTVYDRNNMAAVKDVIPLPVIFPKNMAACSVSNCVYVLNDGSNYCSVLRITKNEEHQFKITPWISDLRLSSSSTGLNVSVTDSGSLIVLSKQKNLEPTVVSSFDAKYSMAHFLTMSQAIQKKLESTVVSIFNAKGSMTQSIMMSPAIHGFTENFSVIQKSNGNLILAGITAKIETELKEIDPTGRIVRQYRALLFGHDAVAVADPHGRIVIVDTDIGVQLLDSEFNLLQSFGPPLELYGVELPLGMHYDRERNEIVRLSDISGAHEGRVLTISRYSEV